MSIQRSFGVSDRNPYKRVCVEREQIDIRPHFPEEIPDSLNALAIRHVELHGLRGLQRHNRLPMDDFLGVVLYVYPGDKYLAYHEDRESILVKSAGLEVLPKSEVSGMFLSEEGGLTSDPCMQERQRLFRLRTVGDVILMWGILSSLPIHHDPL
jgi:hypothetical protein